MDNPQDSFYERIIDTLNSQIQRQDEYIKMLILRTNVSSKVEQYENSHTDLYQYLQSNLNNNCVKFVYNENIKYESIIAFASNVCNFIHNHVVQFVNNEDFEELEQKLLNDEQMKDEGLQAKLQKVQRYIHNLNNLKLPDVQVRLIKKVFSTRFFDIRIKSPYTQFFKDDF